MAAPTDDHPGGDSGDGVTVPATSHPEPPTATAPRPPDGPAHGRTGRYLVGVGLVIMLAGVLFGYDQGVISGALDGIQKEFSVGTLLLEVITSWVTLGAMAGALVAGGLADRRGRRWTIVARVFALTTQYSRTPWAAWIGALVLRS